MGTVTTAFLQRSPRRSHATYPLGLPLPTLQVCDRQLTDANRSSIRDFCQV